MPSSQIEIARDTTLFGVRSLVVAIGYLGISKVLIGLGTDEAAASSIITTTQGLIVGTGAGFVSSIGGEISKVKGDYIREPHSEACRTAIAHVIKTGLIKTLLIGGIGGGICITSKYWLPPMLSDQTTANYAADYLITFSPAVLYDFLLLYASQLAFKIEKNAWLGLLSSVTFRIPSIFLADYLGKSKDLRAKGVGLSSSIIGLANVLLYSLWFCRSTYRDLLSSGEYTWENFIQVLKTLLKKGWKLSLQRVTEWGNLFIIVQIVGAWSNKNLLAVQPSVLLITLMGQLVQGFSLAGMMIATEDSKALKKLKQEAADTRSLLSQAQTLTLREKFKKVKHNFWVGNGAGLGCNLLLGVALWSAKNVLLEWTLPNDVEEDTKQLANTLYLLNLASTLGDTLRVITGGLLFSYDDLMFPIMVSLIFMTAMGVPIGLGIGLSENENIIPLFLLRLLTILVAAGMNVRRFFSFLKEDDNISQDTHDTSINPFDDDSKIENNMVQFFPLASTPYTTTRQPHFQDQEQGRQCRTQ